MQQRIKPTLKIFGVIACLIVVALAALFALSSSLRHEVTERSSDISVIEELFPSLEGHVVATDWSVRYTAEPITLLPGPTDYELWGLVSIDDQLSGKLLADYAWEKVPSAALEANLVEIIGDYSQTWYSSPDVNDSVLESVNGCMYFDRNNTLAFSIRTM